MTSSGLTVKDHGFYQKWLRFFLDFCLKYRSGDQGPASLELFIAKLKEKGQSTGQQEQARCAINTFFEFSRIIALQTESAEPVAEYVKKAAGFSVGQVKNIGKPTSAVDLPQQRRTGDVPPSGKKTSSPIARLQDVETRGKEGSSTGADDASSTKRAEQSKAVNAAFSTGRGPSWESVFTRLRDEIALRHYSPKTLKSYRHYVVQLQTYTGSIDPQSLTTDHVKEFLSFLAVKKQVSASSQNLAFNSLLFFFRHVLGREFGKVEGVARAKRRPYIPVVLSREEVDSIILHLEPPYDLVVKLLYGCGLRLSECVGLRVQCLNFSAGVVTVHDGKGQKDRTVPLPQTVVGELRRHVAELKELHRRDLAKEYGGVFLMNALERKYKNAAREFVWQWLFPAKQLTRERGTEKMRRYHLHPTHVQKAIRRAVDEAGICKRATSHTFRHSYASHLLQNNFDIRTIQELLGHGDVRTTMIYTHTIRSPARPQACSPLDF